MNDNVNLPGWFGAFYLVKNSLNYYKLQWLLKANTSNHIDIINVSLLLSLQQENDQT